MSSCRRLAGLFFVVSVLRFSRQAPFQYSMYAGFAALMVSGILRGMETFSQQRAWNDPDVVWVTLLGLVNWSANVFLPLYGVLQVVIADHALRRNGFPNLSRALRGPGISLRRWCVSDCPASFGWRSSSSHRAPQE